MRVTKTDLFRIIKRINNLLNASGHKGSYSLYIANGGYTLVKIVNEQGGQMDMSHRVSGREMYYILTALENGLIDVILK